MVKGDKAEEFTVVFREIYNDILIESYDPLYASLEGIGMRAAALKAGRLLPAFRVERVRRLLSCYKGSNCTHSYIENYGSKGRWKVSAHSAYPVVTLKGARTGSAPFSEISTLTEGTAVLSLAGGKADLAHISDSAAEIAGALGGRENLLRLLTPAAMKAYPGKDRTLTRRTKLGILTARLSGFEGGGLPFVHITLGIERGAMGELERSSLIAMAVTDDTGDRMVNMNPGMKALISSGRLTEKYILSSYPVRSSLSQGFTRCGMTGDRGFILSAVPEYGAKGLMRVMIFAAGCDTPHIIDDSDFDILTPSESKVVRLAAEGKTSRMIGCELNISEGTVKRELFTSCKKLGVCSRIELITKLYHLT